MEKEPSKTNPLDDITYKLGSYEEYTPVGGKVKHQKLNNPEELAKLIPALKNYIISSKEATDLLLNSKLSTLESLIFILTQVQVMGRDIDRFIFDIIDHLLKSEKGRKILSNYYESFKNSWSIGSVNYEKRMKTVLQCLEKEKKEIDEERKSSSFSQSSNDNKLDELVQLCKAGRIDEAFEKIKDWNYGYFADLIKFCQFSAKSLEEQLKCLGKVMLKKGNSIISEIGPKGCEKCVVVCILGMLEYTKCVEFFKEFVTAFTGKAFSSFKQADCLSETAKKVLKEWHQQKDEVLMCVNLKGKDEFLDEIFKCAGKPWD